MGVVVLCDFDGTVISFDVYEVLLKKYGTSYAEELFEMYVRGELRSQGVLEKGWDCFTSPREVLEDEMRTMEIDPDFLPFYNWCTQREWEVGILSDGLDWYIRGVLAKYRLESMPVFANELHFESEKPVFTYPYLDTECPICGKRFAVCKRNVVRSFKEKGQTVVFIGDGSSDKCAAPEADVVVARRKLKLICEEEGIPFIPFNTFADINSQLSVLEQEVKKKLR